MTKIKPWIQGLIDNLAGSNLIRSTSIQNKNRLALILLDSALEIAFKNYLEFGKKINIPKHAIKEREQLHTIIKRHTNFDNEVWDQIVFFYKLRCDLYHEEAEKTLTDSLIEDFHELVEFVIDQMFAIESRKLVPAMKDIIPCEEASADRISINQIKEKVNVIVAAVKDSQSKNAQEIQEALRRMGYRDQLPVGMINANLKNWYRHLFYYDKGSECWKLSDEGKRRYEEIKKAI